MSLKKKLLTFLENQRLDDAYLSELVSHFSDTTINAIYSDLKYRKTDNEIITDVTDATDMDKRDRNDTLYVFSDGNCKRNGKVNCVAGYSVLFTEDSKSPLYKFNCTKIIVSNPTNNKAELYGINKICKIIYDNYKLFYKKNIIICTDSNYSINCVSVWHPTWVENNWITSKGEPVKNKELISSITYLIEKLKKANITITFQHVNAHMSEPSNKTSIDWFLWRGNAIVDKSINVLLGEAKGYIIEELEQGQGQGKQQFSKPKQQEPTKKKLIIEKRG
jgi:ribonuclease HI